VCGAERGAASKFRQGECVVEFWDGQFVFIYLKVNIVANKKTLYKFNAQAFVDDTLMAISDFSAMLVDQEKAS
jgi:hypothetical protein